MVILADGGLSTLTRRSDLSEADGQQIKLTGSCGEQREGREQP